MKASALFINFILTIVVMVSSCGETDPLYAPIHFERKASMPGPGRSSAVGFAINGKGYVALGRKAARSEALNDCWEYDPASDTWAEKSNFPGIPRVKAAVAVLNGIAYIGLGTDIRFNIYTDSICLQDFWSYDPAYDKWTRLADLPGNSTIACVSFTYNNSVYFGEGGTQAGFTNEWWKYNPEENKWTAVSGIPEKQRAGAVACSDGISFFAGTGYDTYNERDWWEYFPQNDTWRKRKPLPATGRENAIGLAVNHRFFVSTGRRFGGTLTNGKVLSDILEYDPKRNEWHKRGNLDGGNRENAVSFTIDGKGYIGFGENDSTILNDLWCFEP